MLRHRVELLLVLPLIGLSGCSSNFSVPKSTPVTISITAPSNSTLYPGQSAQFTASVSNATNTSVIWEVDSIVGGSSQIGSISTAGLYTAPSTFASTSAASTTVTISASAAANTSATETATVTLLAAPTVTLSPSSAEVIVNATKQFTASFTNLSNTAVTWQVNGVSGGSTSTGTISPSGLYTAPTNVPVPATVNVTAASQAYPSAFGAAAVTILALPPVVVVSPATASVPGNTTQQFTAAVTNTKNTAVTWDVNGIPGGNSSFGTISTTGFYTAPAAIPTPAAVIVSAVSVENNNSVGSATVTITAPEVVVVKPGTASLGLDATQQFTGKSSIPGDTLTWQVNGVQSGDATYGTITNSGLYTAPVSQPSDPVVMVKAVSLTNPAIFGVAVVSIGNLPPAVSVSPGPGGVLFINTSLTFSAVVTPSSESQAVRWQVNGFDGGNETVGTITPSGIYTAPLLVPASPLVTISAISTTVPTLSGNSSVTISLPKQPIAVTVSPSALQLMTSQTSSSPFKAIVTPINNTSVVWTVYSNIAAYGCSAAASNACGSIDANGSYTAPMAVPGGGQSANVTVRATSVADSTKWGEATVTITPEPTPMPTINPPTPVVCAIINASVCGMPSSMTLSASAGADFPTNIPLTWTWNLGCINSDDGDGDSCGDAQDPTSGEPDDDGPGTIAAPDGGTPGSTVQNSLSVIFTSPQTVNSAPPFLSSPCPDAGPYPNGQFAWVPLTVSTVYKGITYTSSAPTCIKVLYQF